MSREQTDAEFLEDLFRDLRGGRWSRAAWARFWSRAWVRASGNMTARPRRGLELGAWAVVAAVALVWLGAGPGAWAWFAYWTAWTALHLGLVRTEDGQPYDSFLLPNGLSYLRLALAPLAATVQPEVVLALLLTDLADGPLARGLDQRSRLGRVMDPLADLSILTALAIGLHAAGVIPAALLVMVVVRYPCALVCALVFVTLRGPVVFGATWIGKVTMVTTSAVLMTGAFYPQFAGLWGLAWLAATLLAANFAWLTGQAVRLSSERGSERGRGS